MMLVKELISHMHCNQVASISIHEFCKDDIKKKEVIINVYREDTLGSTDNLSIPEDILNREVDYYFMDHRIVTTKRIENEYKTLPYNELVLDFSIKLKEAGK